MALELKRVSFLGSGSQATPRGGFLAVKWRYYDLKEKEEKRNLFCLIIFRVNGNLNSGTFTFLRTCLHRLARRHLHPEVSVITTDRHEKTNIHAYRPI